MVARRRAVCLVPALLGGLGLIWASGVVFWLALGVVMVSLAGVLLPVQSRSARFAPIALAIGSVILGLVLLEAALWLWERAASEPLPEFDAQMREVPIAPDLPPEIRAKIARMQSAPIMPPAWQKRDLAKLPGTDPYMWHGVLHQIDANDMRREEPFPPRDPARSRIIVVGERSDALMRVVGLQPDFYADLLVDFDARYERFGGDVAAMNEFVTRSGLPPMVAMVLDQGPRLHGPGRKIALAAEHQLRAAGIETVPSDDFYRRYDGRSFGVSRWEGHPNEEAHAIWAAELAAAIRPRPELARFRHMAEVAHDQQR
jgi:hypothetical protein